MTEVTDNSVSKFSQEKENFYVGHRDCLKKPYLQRKYFPRQRYGNDSFTGGALYCVVWCFDKITNRASTGSATGRSGYSTPYKFTGKELDKETNLYYFGARYYDARMSRWLSTDPAIEKYLPNKNKLKVKGEDLKHKGLKDKDI